MRLKIQRGALHVNSLHQLLLQFGMVSAINLAKRPLVIILKSLAVAYGLPLSLGRDSPDSEVCTAYRNVPRKVHPDRGGDLEQQKALNSAHGAWQEAVKESTGRGGNNRPHPKVVPHILTMHRTRARRTFIYINVVSVFFLALIAVVCRRARASVGSLCEGGRWPDGAAWGRTSLNFLAALHGAGAQMVRWVLELSGAGGVGWASLGGMG